MRGQDIWREVQPSLFSLLWVEELVTLCSPCSCKENVPGTGILEDLHGETLFLVYARASQVMEEICWGETAERSSIGDSRQHPTSEGSHRICLHFKRLICNTSHLTGPFSRPRSQTAKKTCFHYPGYHLRVSGSDLVRSV